MSYEYFEAEAHVSTYNKFRPSPPKALIERIVEYTSENVRLPLDLAVDIGCGSGQSTEVLAPYFNKVLGIDPSPQIIKEARKKCQNSNVFYCICPAEKMDVEDKTVDVLTICQAVHWLDLPKFYSEAERILKPKGCFAVYGYNLPEPIYEDNEELKTIIKKDFVVVLFFLYKNRHIFIYNLCAGHRPIVRSPGPKAWYGSCDWSDGSVSRLHIHATKYYKDVLGNYTLPQSRQVYLENYTSKEYNDVYFIEGEKMQREENFLLENESDLNDIIGYITSWSAFQNYIKNKGEESGQKLLKTFRDEFNSLVGKTEKSKKLKVRFNYFLLLGKKKSQQ